MTTNANSGTVQSGGIPPVTDEDIKPQATEPVKGEEKESSKKEGTKEERKSTDSKAGAKQETESQPQETDGAKEKGPGPWDAELQKRGLTDPAFDAFLREVIQPYVTQLEQGGGGEIDKLFNGDVERAGIAAQLLEALVADPETAYRELGELLGISPGAEGEEEGDLEDVDLSLEGEGDEDEEEPLPHDERLQYVEELMQREQQAQEDAEYKALLDELGNRIEGFDPELFTHMILSHGGNLDAALNSYMKWHRPPEPKEEAPPVVGGAQPVPPEAPKYKSLDDAISAYMSEERARTTR